MGEVKAGGNAGRRSALARSRALNPQGRPNAQPTNLHKQAHYLDLYYVCGVSQWKRLRSQFIQRDDLYRFCPSLE